MQPLDFDGAQTTSAFLNMNPLAVARARTALTIPVILLRIVSVFVTTGSALAFLAYGFILAGGPLESTLPQALPGLLIALGVGVVGMYGLGYDPRGADTGRHRLPSVPGYGWRAQFYDPNSPQPRTDLALVPEHDSADPHQLGLQVHHTAPAETADSPAITIDSATLSVQVSAHTHDPHAAVDIIDALAEFLTATRSLTRFPRHLPVPDAPGQTEPLQWSRQGDVATVNGTRMTMPTDASELRLFRPVFATWVSRRLQQMQTEREHPQTELGHEDDRTERVQAQVQDEIDTARERHLLPPPSPKPDHN